MRAYDLALMLALFGAVMGLLDSSAVWEGGDIYHGPEVINQTIFDKINVIEQPTGLDRAASILGFIWTMTLLIFQVLHSIVHIAPIISDVFGGSSEATTVAYTIQVGIWLTYLIALYQAKTGKSLKGME